MSRERVFYRSEVSVYLLTRKTCVVQKLLFILRSVHLCVSVFVSTERGGADERRENGEDSGGRSPPRALVVVVDHER